MIILILYIFLYIIQPHIPKHKKIDILIIYMNQYLELYHYLELELELELELPVIMGAMFAKIVATCIALITTESVPVVDSPLAIIERNNFANSPSYYADLLQLIVTGAKKTHPEFQPAIKRLLQLTIDCQREQHLKKHPCKFPRIAIFWRLYIFVFIYLAVHLIFALEFISPIILALGAIGFVHSWWTDYQCFVNSLVMPSQVAADDMLCAQQSPDLATVGSAILSIHTVFSLNPNPTLDMNQLSVLGLVSDIQPTNLSVCFFLPIILSPEQVSIKCEEKTFPLQDGCALYDATWLHSVTDHTPTECPTIILDSLSAFLTGFAEDFLDKMRSQGFIKPV